MKLALRWHEAPKDTTVEHTIFSGLQSSTADGAGPVRSPLRRRPPVPGVEGTSPVGSGNSTPTWPREEKGKPSIRTRAGNEPGIVHLHQRSPPLMGGRAVPKRCPVIDFFGQAPEVAGHRGAGPQRRPAPPRHLEKVIRHTWSGNRRRRPRRDSWSTPRSMTQLTTSNPGSSPDRRPRGPGRSTSSTSDFAGSGGAGLMRPRDRLGRRRRLRRLRRHAEQMECGAPRQGSRSTRSPTRRGHYLIAMRNRGGGSAEGRGGAIG